MQSELPRESDPRVDEMDFSMSALESGKNLVRLARLERATLCLEGRCSIHLSYRRTPQIGGNSLSKAGVSKKKCVRKRVPITPSSAILSKLRRRLPRAQHSKP